MKLKTFIIKIKKAYQAKRFRAECQKHYEEHREIEYKKYCNWLKNMTGNGQQK